MSSGFKNFLVAPERTGVDLGADPWLIPQDAFQSIFDAYSYLGVINKRDGFSWFDQVPHVIGATYQNITNITLAGDVTLAAPLPAFLTTGAVVRLTDVQGLAPGVATDPGINTTRWTITVTGPASFSINTPAPFVGAFVPGFGTASFFPARLAAPFAFESPVTAIANWIDPDTNSKYLMVLDSQRASIYDPLNQCLIPIGVTDQFTAPIPFFFWWENYFTPTRYDGTVGNIASAHSIFFTNNVDTIFRWNFPPPASQNYAAYGAGLIPFIPHFTAANDPTDAVNTCLMIKAVGSRLVLFNTSEGNVPPERRSVRIRWCRFNFDPTEFIAAPLVNPWNQIDPEQGGGFFDLRDTQNIITLGQIQRNIILASQDQTFSSWVEMRAVNDATTPFSFTTISSSRNIESTFGTVVLDRQITAVGNTGLISCDGNTTSRYDGKIPQFAIDNIDQEKFQTCFAARNDQFWQSWLLYPSGLQGEFDTKETNQILVYNYQDGSWSIYRPSFQKPLNGVDRTVNITCLGTTLSPPNDPVWISYGMTLPDWAWIDFGEETWISNTQKAQNLMIGGDDFGNVWYMDSGGGDAADDVIFGDPDDNGEAIELNLVTRQWYPFASEAIAAQFGYVDILVDGSATTTASITFNVDNETSNYLKTSFSLVNWENIVLGTIDDITNANPALVTSIDHGLVTGDVVFIYGVVGMTEVNNTFFTITKIDDDNFELTGVSSTLFGVYIEDGVLTSQAIFENTFWTRVWANQTGVFHQMQILSGGVDEEFRIHAMNCAFRPTGRIYKG